MNNQENFLNVHEILQDAATESKTEAEAQVTQTFKLPENQKARVKEVCAANGTTPSKFYQKCTERLLADYVS